MTRTVLHRLPNRLRVALVAVAGMLLAADGASACTSTAQAGAGRSCCISHPAPQCDCGVIDGTEPADAGAVRYGAGTAMADRLATGDGFAVGPHGRPNSCECGPQVPSAPEVKPRTTRGPGRTDRDQDAGHVALTAPTRDRDRAFGSATTSAGPNDSTPKSPLYLRNSRLLI